MTLCDKGERGQNWPKKRYVIVEWPLIRLKFKLNIVGRLMSKLLVLF